MQMTRNSTTIIRITEGARIINSETTTAKYAVVPSSQVILTKE